MWCNPASRKIGTVPRLEMLCDLIVIVDQSSIDIESLVVFYLGKKEKTFSLGIVVMQPVIGSYFPG
jgi:hypothetical protein